MIVCETEECSMYNEQEANNCSMENNIKHCPGRNLKEKEAPLSSLSSVGLYGAVQWINDKPILDGMPYFETEEACIEYAGRMGERHTPPGISVRYTIIRLERAI